MPFEISRTQIGIAVVVLIILVMVSVPLFMGTSKKSLRAEVPTNVDAIRMSEIEYHGAFESYVSAKAAPRDPLSVDSKAVKWTSNAGFDKLSWAPEQAEVRGSYAVNAKADGFTVIGVCDIDDDQSQARYEASLDNEARATTDAAVF